ncbi:MAG: DUF3467 domain-containing protein [Anaerolineae bacterium]|nr:DUF3467 domain-containing protein [Anaerolineae bacterium]
MTDRIPRDGPANESAHQPLRRAQIKVEVPADLPGQYMNLAMITHSLSEVILDFAQVLPGVFKTRVQTRLILSPTNAKLLHKALGESLAKYEAAYGEIKTPPSLADQLFSVTRPIGGATPEETSGDSGHE